ncbi:MAG: hypothetical protein HY343_12160 [Lentisphaerae bacterium]|nr:hypothetical protein [Lentisphaerota bacterium]
MTSVNVAENTSNIELSGQNDRSNRWWGPASMRLWSVIFLGMFIASGCRQQPDAVQAQQHLRQVLSAIHPDLASTSPSLTNFVGWADKGKASWLQLKGEFVVETQGSNVAVYWLQYQIVDGHPTNILFARRNVDGTFVNTEGPKEFKNLPVYRRQD